MKHPVLIALTLSLALGLTTCVAPGPEPARREAPSGEPAGALPTAEAGAPVPEPAEASAGHPELSEQLKLVSCAQCHRKVTPKVYREWHASTHGITNVKCYQCHGTYEDFHAEPEMDRCAACHTRQLGSRAAEKKCWECHVPHRFRGHLVEGGQR